MKTFRSTSLLLAGSALALALAAGPVRAGDVWDILQDFDITGKQNVNNVLNGAAVSNAQSGINTANSTELVDVSPDSGLASGDSYRVRQYFDEEQIVTNDASASVGNATVAQSGADTANFTSITDANGGSTDGDSYSITQNISSVGGSEVASQRVENTLNANGVTGSITASSQSANVQGNVAVLADTGGGTSLGNAITVAQDVGSGLGGGQVAEQVSLNTASGTGIDGLEQTAVQRANQVDLNLTNQSGTATVNITQNTTEQFNQSIVNTASASASAVNVSQSGTNLANIVNWAD